MKKVYYCLLSLLAVSCMIGGTQRGDVINVQKTDVIYLQDIIAKQDFVALKTSEDNDIIRATKIIVNKSCLYVLDAIQNIIFEFDLKGDYLRKLNRRGRGPGEYVIINDFYIDPLSGNIQVLDSYSSSIITYDADFYFLKETELPFKNASYFQPVNDSIAAFYSSSEGKACLFDSKNSRVISDMTVSNRCLEYKTPFKASNSPFKSYNGELLFLASARKQIYRITHRGFDLKYSFSFGDKEENPFEIKEFEEDRYYINKLQEWRTTDKVYSVNNFVETDSIILFSCNSSLNVVVRKSDNNIFTLEKGIPFSLESDNCLYAVIPKNIIEELFTNGFINISSEQRTYLQKVEDNNNPIIVKYQLK